MKRCRNQLKIQVKSVRDESPETRITVYHCGSYVPYIMAQLYPLPGMPPDGRLLHIKRIKRPSSQVMQAPDVKEGTSDAG